MSKTILAIFAHASDCAFGPGGTLIKYAREGAAVDVVVATAVKPENQPKSEDNLECWDSNEMQQAARVMGARKLYYLDFETGLLSQSTMSRLKQSLTTKILDIKPDIVITFDPAGISRNLDHIAVSIATDEAYKLAADGKKVGRLGPLLKPWPVQKLYHYVIPESLQQKFNLEIVSLPDEKITTVVDINPFFATKMKAVRCHKNPGHEFGELMHKLEGIEHHFEFFHLSESRVRTTGMKEIDLFEEM